jgi:hypothetical protein
VKLPALADAVPEDTLPQLNNVWSGPKKRGNPRSAEMSLEGGVT